MTIDELENKLQKLDPNLEIVRDHYMKSEVLVIKPDLLAVKGQYFIYDFSNKRFIRNGLLEWFNNTDTFAFDKMQSLLNRYWYGSKESQKISKDSKNGNGSTAAFSKFASNDSQKKTKEQLIYDFVDEIADHNFKATQTMTLHKTSSISIKADEVGTPCLNIYLTGILDDRIPENPIQIKADDINEKSSSQLGWLLNRASKLVSDLRSM